MAQIPPIEDAYIDDIIKAAGAFNPAIRKTQGVKLRELMKLFRDRFEQEVSAVAESSAEAIKAYDPAKVYDKDEIVYVEDESQNRIIYQSLQDNNTGVFYTDTTHWKFIGYPRQNLVFSDGFTQTGNVVKLGGSYAGDIRIGGIAGSPLLGFGNIDTTNAYTTLNIAGSDYSAGTQSFQGSGQLSTSLFLIKSVNEASVKLQEAGGFKMLVTDQLGNKGLEEAADYSANKTDYSYVTKKMLNDGFVGLSKVASTGLYSDLVNRPTSLSQFGNDLGNYGNFAYHDGSNALGTWGIGISGNAASATNSSQWGTLDGQYIVSGGIQSGGLATILGKHTNGYAYQFTSDAIKNFLSLGALAGKNAINGNEVHTEVGNSAYDSGVAQFLRWKNYGSGHVIFDASQGISPAGSVINSSEPDNNWVNTYPTLMGWNGNNTYGVRVGSSKYAENWTNAGQYSDTDTSVNTYLMGFGADSKWHPISVGYIRNFLGLGSAAYADNALYHRYGGFSSDANTAAEHTSTFTYAVNAPSVGTLMHFGAQGYGTQFNTEYGSGNTLSFRTRNGDNGSWNPWKEIWHEGMNRHWQLYNGSAGTAYNDGTLELINNGNSRPVLGLHWAGVVASTITMEASGRVAIMNNPGTSYENFVANNISAAGYLSVAAQVDAQRGVFGFDSGTPGSVNSSDWFRSGTSGAGWFHQVHGGGIYMLDSTWVRVYNGKGFLADNTIRATDFYATSAEGYTAGNYGVGLVGQYSPTNYQNVFSMGSAYKPAIDGTSLSNMYGIAWTHSNIGGQSVNGLSHQALFVIAGQTASAVGDGIWTRSNIVANGTISAAGGFYDTSDARLKEEIDQSFDVRAVRARTYLKGGKVETGYYAQEVEAIMPHIVIKNEEDHLLLNYNQVLVAKIANLEEDMENMQKKIDQLIQALKN